MTTTSIVHYKVARQIEKMKSCENGSNKIEPGVVNNIPIRDLIPQEETRGEQNNTKLIFHKGKENVRG